MTNSTIPAVGSTELIKANDNKGLEKAKPPADEHPVVKDEAVKGKPALDRINFVRNIRNQVSLYEFNDQGQWLIRGTGHVVCVQPQNQPDAWWIVVRCKYREKNIQLGGKIRNSLEAKLRNSEAQLRQTSESNRQLTADHNTLQQQLTVQLNILNAKNREILKRNCELEQELSNSQAKIQDLKAKFDQTDVAQVIAVMKKCYEKVDKLENGEILRLEKEVAKLSTENEMKNEENIEIRNKLVESEKRIADMNKKNAEMAEKLKSWDYVNQQLVRITEFAEGIRKKMPESKVEQNLQQQSPPRLDPIVPQATSKQQSQEEEVTKLGPDGDSANGSRIDTQKILEEVGAKNAANVAAGTEADII